MKLQLADRLQQVEEYYFSKKLQEIALMRSQGKDVINLGIGSPDLVPPSGVIEKAITCIQQPTSHGYSSYRSIPELRKAMSSWLQGTYQIILQPDQEILPLLGSKEGILYLSLALLNPGDRVLIPNPGYPAYASVAKLIGAEIVYYDLKGENNWLPDFDQLQKLDLSRCKLMWVNYPHMPTGASATGKLFKDLISFGERKKIVICNDNPYGLILNETPPLSILSFDKEKKVSCELNSLSKSFNMAGWRVGVFLGCRELIDAVIAVKSQVDSGMFLPIQMGAIEALGVGEEWHKKRNGIYEERRRLVREIFDLLGFDYRKDQVGLFVWAKAPDKIKEVHEYLDLVLHGANVFITPGMIFGSNGQRYARISLCAPVERLKEAVDRIRSFLA